MTDAARWGIQPGYRDVAGRWCPAPPATMETFLAAMGAGGDDPPPGPAVIAGPGRPHPCVPPGELHLEDGATVRVHGDLPLDLPLGYHRFVADDPTRAGSTEGGTPLIVSPRRCWLPEGLRHWGWAAQLYATRSASSWGVGDLADLRRLGQWSAAQGAGLALINPLHAALPVGGQQPSPYFASSRCFRNPLYLRIEEVPGAQDLPELPELAAAGRALNADRGIDRDAVWRLKSVALEAIFARFGGDPAFDRYREDQGQALRQYATFCALSECHGVPWERWPVEVRRPDGAGIAPFSAREAGMRRIRYHSWLQWLLDEQLRSAGESIGVVQDLAIGADAGGADAWRWQDCTALGVRVGAPPDEFNIDGQNWALPPFDPWKLRSAGYQPFIELVRAGLRGGGGMRFDHVMGLFRLFWIPADGSPRDGSYVHYPAEDLLDILALESHRAGAYIVGEDLGTVEAAHRTELAERQVLSYRLLWFEPSPPGREKWPARALAAATTHDLPTVAGLWTGGDIKARRDRGLPVNDEAEVTLRAKIKDWIGADDDLPVPEVIERVYRLLGQAPCSLVTATLDDTLAVEERPNMPGTLDEWPNWRIALPKPLEEIEGAPLAHSIAEALQRLPPG
ncbi:MAG: 4-alpha-glucanotransferase [Actinomycetota bacterium]|nr:4-alpha-glucanotransferase [Actinomycetota bacterium]MDQ6947114.1 4-alpha-glucanotransferase [Actinomycetota bacterium]